MTVRINQREARFVGLLQIDRVELFFTADGCSTFDLAAHHNCARMPIQDVPLVHQHFDTAHHHSGSVVMLFWPIVDPHGFFKLRLGTGVDCAIFKTEKVAWGFSLFFRTLRVNKALLHPRRFCVHAANFHQIANGVSQAHWIVAAALQHKISLAPLGFELVGFEGRNSILQPQRRLVGDASFVKEALPKSNSKCEVGGRSHHLRFQIS